MVKLVVQIPCLNEAENLPSVIAEIPREIPGVDQVQILVIDDGSTDGTAPIAQRHGADRILRFPRNRGLAVAYSTGMDAALEMGADIIVNTDGDGQYPGAAIPDLIAPILAKKADMVIGDRGAGELSHFSWHKRVLQRLGSWVVRHASATDVPDAPSGFRAVSREAALRLNVFGEFTYTMETLIQAGRKNLKVTSVPVVARKVERPSRLFRSMPEYLKLAAASILRMYAMYRPMPVFVRIGMLFWLCALGLGARFVWYYMHGEGEGKIQSLILATILSTLGIQTFLLALVADLIATNRKLSEDILIRIRRKELKEQTHARSLPVGDAAGSAFAETSPTTAEENPKSDPPFKSVIEIRS